jgi:hypothetical protein
VGCAVAFGLGRTVAIDAGWAVAVAVGAMAQRPMAMAQRPMAMAQRPMAMAQRPMAMAMAQRPMAMAMAQRPMAMAMAQRPMAMAMAQRPMAMPMAQRPMAMAQRPRTVPQQPNLAARRASVAALHRAEVAAEDEAEGRGDPEIDDDAEDDVGAGAGHATSGTNIERVNKLRSDFIAFTKRLTHVPDDEVPPQHITHTLPMRSSIRGSAYNARDWISDYTTRESPWLCDSRLTIKDAYLASGLTSSQMNAGNHRKPGWLSAGERLQHMVRQQPSCTTVDPNTEYGRWFSPIDDAWVFGTPKERHGWRRSLVTIIHIRLPNLYDTETIQL